MNFANENKMSLLLPSEKSWLEALSSEFSAPYYAELCRYIETEYAISKVYPAKERVFAALDLCPLPSVKVVLLGQDPYHGESQAHGLCFSVPDGVKFPPSLRNIFKELSADVGCAVPQSGDLSQWARQGVLLLNTALTVRAGEAASHSGLGWEYLTDAIVKTVSSQCRNVVFLLWGKHAQRKIELVDQTKHLVLTVAHPSPLSAYNGFFGCRHFSAVNKYMESVGRKAISWN